MRWHNLQWNQWYEVIYTQGLAQTHKTRVKSYHSQRADGLPSAGPRPSLSSRSTSASKSSSLGPSAPSLYCTTPSSSHFSFHTSLLLTLPKCPSMAWFYEGTGLWLCLIGADTAVPIWQTHSPSKKAASQVHYLPSSLWSPPLWEGQKLTVSAHEGPTLEQGHSKSNLAGKSVDDKGQQNNSLCFSTSCPARCLTKFSRDCKWMLYLCVCKSSNYFLLLTVSFWFWQWIK